jgi:hypothetical protein
MADKVWKLPRHREPRFGTGRRRHHPNGLGSGGAASNEHRVCVSGPHRLHGRPGAHPGLDGPERVLDGGAADAHGLGWAIGAGLGMVPGDILRQARLTRGISAGGDAGLEIAPKGGRMGAPDYVMRIERGGGPIIGQRARRRLRT